MRRLLGIGLLLLAACGDNGSTPDTGGTVDMKGGGGGKDLSVAIDSGGDQPDFATPLGDLMTPYIDYALLVDLAPPADLTCIGLGCTCVDDKPCYAGGAQAICIAGLCKTGCDTNVPCGASGQKCCNQMCVTGTCCASTDCPAGQVCGASNTCGACTSNNDCGSGALCCGVTGQKSCVIGNCCANSECAGGQTCTGNMCRALCTSGSSCGAGQACCNTACYAGNCCANGDCSGGQACINNTCASCTTDAQCGNGMICNGGMCQTGCNGNVTCAGGSLCCTAASATCKSGGNCSGMCTSGNCCSSSDCPGGQLCTNNQCRTPCSSSSQCGAGSHCCSGYCFSTACVSTLAGSGLGGPGDAPLPNALFGGAYGVLPDGQGNVFYADLRGGSIRVINNGNGNIGPVGAHKVGRVAGGIYGCKAGPAATAEMGQPIGLTRDGSGNLYIADWDCAVIWKLSADFKTVTLLAGQAGVRGLADGTGTGAQFQYPRGLTYGVDGNLYVSEFYGNKIRQVTLAGDVKTVAGSGTSGETDGAGLQATFHTPSALVMDAGGTLFVADWETGTVRMVSGIGVGKPIVSTIIAQVNGGAPYGNAGYSSMGAAAGKVYVPFWNNGVWVLSPPSGGGTAYTATKLITNGSSISATVDTATSTLWVGGWVDNAGDLDNTISQWSLAGTQMSSVGTAHIQGAVDGAGSSATFDFAACSGAIAVDAAGNVWAADRCTQRVRKVAPDGKVTSYGSGQTGEVPGSATTGQFCYPVAITTVGTDVYVANNYCARHIEKIDSSGNITVLGTICVPGEPGCGYPTPPGGMVADAGGNLYVSIYQEDSANSIAGNGNTMAMIVKVPNLANGGSPSWFAGTRNQVGCTDGAFGIGRFGTWPYGLAIDQASYIYVGDGQCGLRKVAPNGTLSTLESGFGVLGVGIGPVLSGGDQTLYVSRDTRIATVNRISGAVTDFAGMPVNYASHFADGALKTAQFWNPYGLATDAAGDILVMDQTNNRIRIIFP